MTKVEMIGAKIVALQEALKVERENLREAIRNAFILCALCKKRSRLFSWVFIKDLYYEYPQGHTGGHWVAMETRNCHIVCPKCGAEIYICNYQWREKLLGLVDSYRFNRAELFDAIKERQRK